MLPNEKMIKTLLTIAPNIVDVYAYYPVPDAEGGRIDLQGAGFFIDDCHILTCAHNVLITPRAEGQPIAQRLPAPEFPNFSRAQIIRVSLHTGEGLKKTVGADVDLVGVDRANDIALLRLRYKCTAVTGLKFRSNLTLCVGEEVGNYDPYYGPSVGIVKKVQHTADGVTTLPEFIGTDLAIQEETAGAPIVDIEGRVVGMQTGYAANGFSFNIAISSRVIDYVLRDLLRYCYPPNYDDIERVRCLYGVSNVEIIRDEFCNFLRRARPIIGYRSVTVDPLTLTIDVGSSFEESGICLTPCSLIQGQIVKVVDDELIISTLNTGDIVLAINGQAIGFEVGQTSSATAIEACRGRAELTVYSSGCIRNIIVNVTDIPIELDIYLPIDFTLA